MIHRHFWEPSNWDAGTLGQSCHSLIAPALPHTWLQPGEITLAATEPKPTRIRAPAPLLIQRSGWQKARKVHPDPTACSPGPGDDTGSRQPLRHR